MSMTKHSEAKSVVRAGLASAKLMQVATSSDNKPWICTVYFVADEKLNLYWLSWPNRRHSRELVSNSKVAVAIAIKPDTPVIGIQAEGKVGQVDDLSEIKGVIDKYVSKFGVGNKFYDNLVAGKNKHQLYKFIPERLSLFDEVNFAQSSPIEVVISRSK